MPLRELFAINTASADYNERDKKGVFYAESWALVHYLMLGNEGRRRPQLIQFLTLLGKSVAPGAAFEQAFQTDYATIEKELREYIGRNSYPVQVYTANEKMQFDAEMQIAPVSEAEAQFYMGDLLMHMNRAEAEEYLQRALALDDKLALPHAAMGMLRMRQRRVTEAKQHLQQAVAHNVGNHLVHYYYAYALSREGMNEQHYVTGYEREAVTKMREHLEKAIQLAPEFVGSYQLMAFINLVTNEKLDSAVGQLKRVLTLEPGRQEAAFMLAQVYLRQQKYDLARQTAAPLAHDGADPQLRAQAQSLLDTIKNVEARLAQFRAEREAAETAPPAPIKATRASSGESSG